MTKLSFDEMTINNSEFIYERFLVKPGKFLELKFVYKIIPDLEFTHTVEYHGKYSTEEINKKEFNNLVFHIGLLESLSYWKLTAARKFTIKAGYLDSTQIEWFKDLTINGMGQYIYENNIKMNKSDIKITVFPNSEKYKSKMVVDSNKLLIPVGGGKDSTVTLALLKNAYKTGVLVVRPGAAASDKIIKVSGIKNKIEIVRKLDKNLYKKNKEGYLNGHIPYSSILFVLSLMAAYLGKYGTVVYSNEASSEEGNIVYRGISVNHQYSKTFEYEKKFNNYNKRYLSNIKIFSILRPLNELQISNIFSKYPEYYSVFRSCNVGQKDGVWCGKCPKCLSTYILLYPFLKKKTVKIFHANLFEDISLNTTLDSLINRKKVKPFECVGTRLELQAALKQIIKTYTKKLPHLLAYARKNYNFDDVNFDDLLKAWNPQNLLSTKYERILKNYEKQIRQI